MPKLNANPNAEANVAFDVVRPGTYRMRVKEITEFDAQSGNHCWRARLEYVDTAALDKLDGSGPANNPGTLLDSSLVVEPADKQGKVRSFVEALGAEWTDLDSDDLIGLECDVKVGVEEYQGEQRNVAKRYLKVD